MDPMAARAAIHLKDEVGDLHGEGAAVRLTSHSCELQLKSIWMLFFLVSCLYSFFLAARAHDHACVH